MTQGEGQLKDHYWGARPITGSAGTAMVTCIESGITQDPFAVVRVHAAILYPHLGCLF